ncbi:MAG: copper-translocating P-type ATPase [Gammaproteobacteria bacterium]|nr:MAG: copper-translocating P-type ATPase [Gammaproteobacteria bacterium]TND02183.1 MAG: copper-translocating P-type ATPase [Gammaproteobacteria bacterium]
MRSVEHGKGHGAGMDMQVMVRDMRNCFFIALVFSIPVFLCAAMGTELLKLEPLFGMHRNTILYWLASSAIVCPD